MLSAFSHALPFSKEKNKNALPFIVLNASCFHGFLKKQTPLIRNWITSAQFKAEPGQLLALPDPKNNIQAFIYGLDENDPFYCLGDLSDRLNEGHYVLEDPFKLLKMKFALLGFALGAYRFNHFVAERKRKNVVFHLDSATYDALEPLVHTHYWVRDLINLPAENLGPSQLTVEAKELAKVYKAQYSCILGDDLLEQGYPLIHTVGRASNDQPRLVEILWGQPTHPKVSLVGKGVCFDTGGLDLKSHDAMSTMKKDMAGAAHAMGLARLIMHFQLPVRLQVLLPIVENGVDGNAYRPGDILISRKGLSIEITNTDAEGRLILADALSKATEGKPELILDFATLTGAARAALGPQVPAFFCNSEPLSKALMKASQTAFEPIWRLPLFAPYKKMIRGKFSDLLNSASTGQAGAITAALFLESFVDSTIPWAHFDIMAWNNSPHPGRPEGGEAMSLHACFHYLCAHYLG